MGKYSGKTCKLTFVMGLVVLYFFVEVFVGFFIQSLALVADAFHMLSDFVALLVGIVATRLMKMPRTARNTYGWQRADIVGTLINTVILSTLCFTIVERAIERFIETHEVHHPLLMVAVGAGGLVINVTSLCILGHHGHSHGSHSHTYGVAIDVAEETSLVNPVEPQQNEVIKNGPMSKEIEISLEQEVTPNSNVATSNNTPCNHHGDNQHNNHNDQGMNMKAVFLHVMADALGSVIVVISALIIYFSPTGAKWTLYVDPGMSLILVAIIMISTSKLLYQSALILLQSVPKNVKLSKVKNDIEKIVGTDKVHDLHIWRLQGDCIIGTVHIRCQDLGDYLTSSTKIKSIFHDSNIHCTTIQPEFDVQQENGLSGSMDMKLCVIGCPPNDCNPCNPKTCCPTDNSIPNNIHPAGDISSPEANV